MPFPNFRRLYSSFRSAEQERSIQATSMHRLGIFITLCVVLKVARIALRASAPSTVALVAVGG
ncbi:hypothetical protein GGF32_007184 [Allomyces javanicus]|nr:hypothetical protein GGF32_007184 [Allomyces javanicus]